MEALILEDAYKMSDMMFLYFFPHALMATAAVPRAAKLFIRKELTLPT